MRLGRPRQIRFPICRTEVYHGRDVPRTVEENTTVNCVQCGGKFLINRDTAYVSYDESLVEMVRCPRCGRRASIYHYYDRVVKRKHNSKGKGREL